MANSKATERPSKKVRLAISSKGKSTTTKSSSPRPEKAKSAVSEKATPSSKGKEKASAPTSAARSKVKGKARQEHSELPTSFKVVAGSYEKLLYGLDGTVTIDELSNLHFHLKPLFIFPAHVSCIKAVAASPHGGKWLATGSADEIIKVWDLRRRKEIGGLMHHEGSITHLVFPSRSHLLSASEDGTLCLFRARDWAVLRALKGHKGRVNALAVHPSGKVALSVGKDKALRMWDLMRGKGVASTKLGKEGEVVCWSISGTKFAVQSGSTIDIHGTNMDLLYTITHPSRIHDIRFCTLLNKTTEVLLVGAEDKKLSVYHIPKDKRPTIIAEMVGHTNRIKAVQILDIALPTLSDRKSTTIVCTVSSDGFVNVYDLVGVPPVDESKPLPDTIPKKIEPVTSYDSKGTRLTCVTLADGDIEGGSSQNGKRKRDDDEVAESEEEDDSEWGGAKEEEEEASEGDEEERDE